MIKTIVLLFVLFGTLVLPAASGSEKKKEFDFYRYATTDGDIDLILSTSISLEHENRFDEAIKFAHTAQRSAPLSKSVAFLIARIKSKKLAASGKKADAKKIVAAIFNDPILSTPAEKKVPQSIKWDLSDMYAQKPGALEAMLKEFLKQHPRDEHSSTSTILWQTAGAPASFFSNESQYYELKARPARLDTAFVLGKEAYLLGARKSSSVRTVFGRIALKYINELKVKGKTTEASSAAREFLATGCGYNRSDIKSFLIK